MSPQGLSFELGVESSLKEIWECNLCLIPYAQNLSTLLDRLFEAVLHPSFFPTEARCELPLAVLIVGSELSGT